MTTGEPRRRLAIVGGGSSGLICLKYALELLPDWEVRCFEQSGSITGAWGNPYPRFVSTSTKYTTQFACYPVYDANVRPDGGASRSEFFREGEYGGYLTDFAHQAGLVEHVTLHCRVAKIERAADRQGWQLTLQTSDDQAALPASPPANVTTRVEPFDAIVLCTGLAAERKQLECDRPQLTIAELTRPDGLAHVTGRCVVVVGGGESAVDFARRLAQPELGNEVYLSLQSGIRVSPRYHPIHGVPSDFLRNRLLLSIHPDLRNWIGQRFVELRIRHQELFARLFPPAHPTGADAVQSEEAELVARRKEWTYKLTKGAKDDLFNMFHNKSDDFLEDVAAERIKIIGPPIDRSFTRFRSFDSTAEWNLQPDLVAPAIGFRPRLADLSGGALRLADYYLACCHVEFPDAYLVGHARPIIGNIPSMSEMQARYVCGLIAGRFPRPAKLAELHQADRARRQARFRKIDLDTIFAVEMFPYCDQLARRMNASVGGGLLSWLRTQLTPASTLQYRWPGTPVCEPPPEAPVYMPTLLILLLLALKPIDWLYRLLKPDRS